MGSYTSGGGRGITVAAVDPGDGSLAPVAVVDTAPNPAWLALDREAGVLYAVSEADPGAVTAFRVDGPRLTPLGPPVGVGGAAPTHVGLAAGRLLTANYASGSVSSLPLAPGGAVGGPPVVLAHEGSGPDPDRQEAPHAHQVVADPGGRWLLGVDLGTDSVRVCASDPDTGGLRVHARTALRAGSGPRHLAFHPDGEVVYVLHELAPQLTVCRWDGTSGALEPLAEVAVDADPAPEGGRLHPSVVAVAADGRFLWVAVRGSDTLLTLSLEDGAEKPRVAGSVGCGGVWPRDLVPDAAGRRLYVANEWSGDVTWFDVEPETGLPRPAGALEVPAAACVVLG
ncbi:lactonase family protein [Streptomyces sp. DH12]|uniref:lactonase family protein n=1 Tax=Streptomyces sp. DH12 TaxID=2857010 RepID=UPI0027DEF44D|nr:lactonase family protein [Streptomyces sp. DH12]